ncbi:hypothetical protein GCM10010437_015910 [Actinoplanes palleronii]
MSVAAGRGGESPRCQIACGYRPPGGGTRTHHPTADRHRPEPARPRTSTAPPDPSADSCRPLSAERGLLPPHRRRARTSTAPPASITHADRYDNTERRDIPDRNDTPTHLHPNTSGTTPRPQGPTEIKIG